MWKLWGAVAVVCAIAAALGPGTALAGSPCPECSGTYSGSWHATYKLKNPDENTFTTHTLSLSWGATLHWAGGQNVWTLTRADGSFSVTGSPPSAYAGPNCAVTLSRGPDAVVHGETFWGATALGIGPAAQSGFYTNWTVLFAPPAQWGQTGGVTNPLRSSGGAGTPCASQTAEGPWYDGLSGGDCQWDPKYATDWVGFPAGGSFTVPESCTGSGSDGLGDSWTSSLSSTLTFHSPGHYKGGKPIHAGNPGGNSGSLNDVKDLAQEDFKLGWKDAQGPCLQLAESLGVFATGAVWVSASATVPGGIPSGGAIIAAGEVMGAASGKLCADKLGRLLDDYKVFNDPPDPHYLALARVAPARKSPNMSRGCSHVSGNVHGFCLQLAKLVSKLITAAAHTRAVDDALVTTVNRASGSKRAHNNAAFKRQLSHARTLDGQRTAALRAEAKIGREIKSLLPSGNLTRSQSAKTIAYLERKGLRAARVRHIDAGGLSPAALDPIARLVAP